MRKERMVYFIALTITINLFLIYLLLEPKIERIRMQVEGGAIETVEQSQIYQNYYYEYVMVESIQEGEWVIDVYKEVKTLIDQSGQKIAGVDTGNVEYVRYWVGE